MKTDKDEIKIKYELRELSHGGKVYVGIPRERYYIPSFVDNRDQIIMYLQKTGRAAGYFQADGHRVDRNRDSIVNQFLELPDKPEWLLMLDSDMDHPYNIAERLTKWGKPIVAGLYFHRGSYEPFCFEETTPKEDKYGRVTKLWKPMHKKVYDFLEENSVPPVDGAIVIDNSINSPLVECDAVATGTMLIHRSVLEIMEKPIFEYRETGPSEDLQFCWEAKHYYGIPIFCDLSTISGHYSNIALGQSQFRMKYERRGVAYSSYSKEEIASQLGEFLNISPAVALNKIETGNAHMVGDYWNAKFEDKESVTDEEVKEFYEDPYTGKLYLIELIHWNSMPGFQQIKNIFLPLRNMDILELGSGIGSLAIQLALQNNTVDCCEPNNILREFIKHRLESLTKSHELEFDNVNFISDGWRVKKEAYDAVVSTDTFEHIPENELKGILVDISGALKVGGRLIYTANFKQQDLYPMHFDHSENWNDWLKEAGLTPLNNFTAIKGY